MQDQGNNCYLIPEESQNKAYLSLENRCIYFTYIEDFLKINE